jgi:muramidase (phage lysozyme)
MLRITIGLVFGILTISAEAKQPPSIVFQSHQSSWGNQPIYMDPIKYAFLDALAKPESGGDYSIKNGSSHFHGFAAFPEGIGPGGTSTASGRYQFISGSWKMIAPQIGARDFSPANQDRGAWFYAAMTYKQRAGRDLENDLQIGHHQKDIAVALQGVWPTTTHNKGFGHISRFDASGKLLPTRNFSVRAR